MLTDEQKANTIFEMGRAVRYHKIKGGIIGVTQYKVTEEDLIFLIREHERILIEKNDLKEIINENIDLYKMLASEDDLKGEIIDQFKKGIILPDGFEADITYKSNANGPDENISIIVKDRKLFVKTKETNIEGTHHGKENFEEIKIQK
jgi:hypothetical protein